MQFDLLTNMSDPILTLVSDPTGIVRERLRGRIRTLRGEIAVEVLGSTLSSVDMYSSSPIPVHIALFICIKFFERGAGKTFFQKSFPREYQQ